MARKTTKPAQPRQAATGSGWDSLAASARITTPDLTEAQAFYIAARYGLDGTRARLVAELAWRCR